MGHKTMLYMMNSLFISELSELLQLPQKCY